MASTNNSTQQPADPILAQINAEMKAQALPPQAPLGAPPGAMPTQPAEVDPMLEQINHEMNQQKYGTPGQQALTAVEGVAKGIAGPVATGIETFLGDAGFDSLKPQEQINRAEANPWTHGVSEGVGFVGGAFTGASEAALLGHAGEAAVGAAKFLPMGEALVRSKIGSAVVRGVVENGLFQAGDEISKAIQGRPSDMIGTALPNIGLSAAIGGAFGVGTGGVSALWNATAGSKVGGLLSAVAKRVGGIESGEGKAIQEIMGRTGIDLPAEVQAKLSSDPYVKGMADTLAQSDNTFGKGYQKKLREIDQLTGETLAGSLGRKIDTIPESFDKYTTGSKIGTTLADEVAQKIDPLANQYRKLEKLTKEAQLPASIADKAESSGKMITELEQKVATHTKELTDQLERELKWGETSDNSLISSEKLLAADKELKALKLHAETPGVTDVLVEKISLMAKDEGWLASKSSDIAKEVNRVLKELPEQKSLKNLTDYIKAVGDNMQHNKDYFANGSMRRAGSMIKGVLRDSETETMINHLGAKRGPKSVTEYQALQKSWKSVSELKDELNDRLGIKSSTTAYSKAIKEAAQTDGEGILNKLSGKNDAHLLNFLAQHFPGTAQAIREGHIDQILSKAKVGEEIHPNKILNGLNDKNFSPQLKAFVTGKEGKRIDAIAEMFEKMKDKNYNFSNTGRVQSRLVQYGPPAAVGMATMLLGHNPALALLLTGFTKFLATDAPDAARLGLLKFLGANKTIDAGAFKSMVDLIQATIKGQNLLASASKAIFSGATKVIPSHMIPSTGKLKELDENLKKAVGNTSSIEDSGAALGHYMPNHAIAMTAAVGNAAQVMNQLRPVVVQNAPLDARSKPTGFKQALYNRQLSIAEQPLMIAYYLKERQLTHQDVALANQLHPDFMAQLKLKLMEDMTDHLSQGKTVPPEIRIGLGKIMGQPLTSSQDPNRVIATQSVFAPRQPDPTQAPKPTNNSKTGLNKLKHSERASLRLSDK